MCFGVLYVLVLCVGLLEFCHFLKKMQSYIYYVVYVVVIWVLIVAMIDKGGNFSAQAFVRIMVFLFLMHVETMDSYFMLR